MQNAIFKCRTQNAECRSEERKDLGLRTKMFALRMIELFRSLPKTLEAQIIGKQVLRSGTSVGAQYREARRARSKAEFLSKLESALQELDETGYWLELFLEAGIVRKDQLEELFQEQQELTAMFISSVNTAKTRE